MTDGATSERPWLKLYGDLPESLDPGYPTALAMARHAMASASESPLLFYFDTAFSGRELDEASDALASAMRATGVDRGDRVVLQLQNMPQFVVGLLATWKLGAAAVPANPMYRERELGLILRDSGARALIQLDELWATVGRPATAGSDVSTVVTTSGLDYVEGEAPAVLTGVRRARHDETLDLVELVEAHRGERPPGVPLEGDDLALLVYTSGTTGPPKGAMNLHRNVASAFARFARWTECESGDRLAAVAPMFHITGLVVNIGGSFWSRAPSICFYRFDPATCLRMIERHRATVSVAAITAYTAMMEGADLSSFDLTSLTKVYSGGAPVPPAVVERWRSATGVYIRNVYGLTEATSLTHGVPPHLEAPVDPTSGALSVGLPASGTVAEVRGPDGERLPPGELGEIVICGPQIVPGYWQRPAESAYAIRDGCVWTGDVGFMDADGWFYVVDRSKDLIVVSGYKVWPREVEDVLCEHEAVRETAVIGVPDPYRGETVIAYVSLRQGRTVSSDELIAFCRERSAAYKVPRQIVVLDDLPKTLSGKILRRELRERAVPAGT